MITMFNPIKKFKDITYGAVSRLDSIAEKPIKFIIPNYKERQDKILEKYLTQTLDMDDKDIGDNKKPGIIDNFIANFNSTTVKSFYMLTDTIGGCLSLMTLNPLYFIAGDIIAGSNQYLRRNRLGKILNSMPDADLNKIKSYLSYGDISGAKTVLHDNYW